MRNAAIGMVVDLARQARREQRKARATLAAHPSEGSLRLAMLLERVPGGWRIYSSGREWIAACDPSVDPALLEAALAVKGRVVVEFDDPPVIVGALSTGRSVPIDRNGNVALEVNQFQVSAQQVLLKTSRSFLQLKASDVELYGQRIVSRAAELVRILGRMVKLN